MGVKTTQKAEVKEKLLITLGNGFKRYTCDGLLWTNEKPYEVETARALELLKVSADDRHPFVLYEAPKKAQKAQTADVEVAPVPVPDPKIAAKAAPPQSPAASGAPVKVELGTAAEAAELGLTPEGEKAVEVG